MIMDASLIITGIGLIAFVVSVITAVTKEIGVLKKIPTSLQVLVLSVLLSPFALGAYSSYSGVKMEWYAWVCSVICGFISAFVAMYGWDKLSEMYSRFRKGGR